MNPTIAFVATGRSGIGHHRRIASVATAAGKLGSGIDMVLVTNAPPDGLPETERAIFRETLIAERRDMAGRLARLAPDLVVLDTMVLPGIAQLECPAVLILRETPEDRIQALRRDDGRLWDRIIVPNPADHWMPQVGLEFAHSIDAAGWIVRKTGPRSASEESQGIVIATGGGGTSETRALLYPALEQVLKAARLKLTRPIRFRQALGPRANGEALGEADETFDPGGKLNATMRSADIVISTAGYNSVLELATTDTPALLAAIPRGIDDQAARARHWGPKLGCWLDPEAPEMAAEWLADQIRQPRRRTPVDLGPDGATVAAELILGML